MYNMIRASVLYLIFIFIFIFTCFYIYNTRVRTHEKVPTIQAILPNVLVDVVPVPVVSDSKGYVKLPKQPIRATITIEGKSYAMDIHSETLYVPVKPFLTPFVGIGIGLGTNAQYTVNTRALVGFKFEAPFIGESVVGVDTAGRINLLKSTRIGDNVSVTYGITHVMELSFGLGVDL